MSEVRKLVVAVSATFGREFLLKEVAPYGC
jgi:hypothetical protein